MKKTKKVLGIGVTVLIVFMALTPFVSANSDSTQSSESSEEASVSSSANTFLTMDNVEPRDENSSEKTVLLKKYNNFYDVFNPMTVEKWDRTDDGDYHNNHRSDYGYNYGYSVQQTIDGGYITVGHAAPADYDYFEVLLIKTDSDGNEEWMKTFAGLGEAYGYWVQQTKDHGYIITGHTRVPDSYDDYILLLKTDSNGTVEWERALKAMNDESRGRSVQQTIDGGYIIIGGWGAYPLWDFLLLKTDDEGNEEWNNTFRFNEFNIAFSGQQTSDGGYIISGYSFSFQDEKAVLIKTYPNGTMEWNRTFVAGPASAAGFYDVQQTSDNGYIVVGADVTGFTLLIKTDDEGNEEWNNTFRLEGFGEEGYSVQQTADGGYIIAGLAVAFDPEEIWNALLRKTDDEGNEEWNKTFAGVEFAMAYDVQQTTDEGYIITGWTSPAVQVPGWVLEVMLIKTDDDGNEEWMKTFELIGENRPPHIPSDPYPENGATDVSVDVVLSWTGGDPDPGDTVTYDVYFGTTSPPPKIESNQTASTYDPGTMNHGTTYYWQIVAWDNHDAYTEGAIWEFTTELAEPAKLEITEIAGGMGVTATIKNVGDAPAENLEWNIVVTGGFLGLVDADVDGNKSSLAVNATEDAVTGSLGFLHLGGLEITVTADADNADKISKDYTAFIFGPFVLNIKEA